MNEVRPRLRITKDLIPRLLKVVIVSAFIDALFSSIFFLMSILEEFNMFMGSLFLSTFLGALFFYLLLWIPLALIIETLSGNHFRPKYRFKNMLIYCAVGSVTLILFYGFSYVKNGEFLLLFVDSVVTGFLTGVIFYHTLVYFHLTYFKRPKDELKRVGISFLLFIIIAAAAHYIFMDDINLEISAPSIEHFGTVDEAQEAVSFAFKSPSFIPGDIRLKIVTVEEMGDDSTYIEMTYFDESLKNDDNVLYIQVSNSQRNTGELQGDYDFIEELTINGTNATMGKNYLEINGKQQTSFYLIWLDEQIEYYIYSNLISEEDLFRLAESFN